jgi:hypothetical protein
MAAHHSGCAGSFNLVYDRMGAGYRCMECGVVVMTSQEAALGRPLARRSRKPALELELEIEKLRTRLNEVAKSVRLDVVAQAWLAGNHDIRQGDYFLLNGNHPTQLSNVDGYDGKWTYMDVQGRSIEPHRVPDQADHDRLYTKAEVAAIIAAVRDEPEGRP